MKTLIKLALFTIIFNISVAFLFAQTVTRPDSNAAKPPSNKTVSNTYANAKLTYNIIEAANHTYGYDVFVDGKLMIHQTSIPAMPGNEGFKTKEDAIKVANLVVAKIKKGEMPPTISIDEMKKLKITK